MVHRILKKKSIALLFTKLFMHTIMFTIGVSMIINPQAKSYLTDSYIVFILKMKSVSEIKIFGLKMMVKSGLEKFILKSLHAGIITEFVIFCTFMK